MVSVKRVSTGKIIYEDFSCMVDLIADGWLFHPSAKRFFINRTEQALNILHGDTPTYLLRELPEKAVMEMSNTYNPDKENDYGGFVAYATDACKLELYEYFNPDVGLTISFPYVRLVKDGNEYEGYGSQDGINWDIRGALPFPEGNKWGLCLEGAGQPLIVHTLSIYKDTNLYFRALPLGGRVEAWDISKPIPELVGAEHEKNYEALISAFNCTFPMELRYNVYDADGTLIAQDQYEDVFGGDEYHCGNFIEVYYNGKPLDMIENDFGYIDSFYKDFRLELRNMIDVPHTNVNVEIKRFYEEFGWEWVEVCKDNEGMPDGNFEKSILIDEVPPDGSSYFWVRITRSAVPVHIEDYLFDFVINVW